jgi:hypothetical protein
MSTFKRRDFLKLGTGLLGGFSIAALACNNESKPNTETTNKDSSGAKPAEKIALSAFGLQLYSVRDELPKDPKGVLKQIADMGYTQVEGYQREKGILWGMTPSEFKTYMSSIGLTMIASHYDVKSDFQKNVDQAAEVGMKFMMFPWE